MDLLKNLDNMITAEEFLVRDKLFSKPLTKSEKKVYIETMLNHNGYIKEMIEFAKLHVEAALKKAENEVNGNLDYVYSLENIK